MCHNHQDSHEEEFLDLAGGKKEYVVTLSAIIEDAKMKGLRNEVIIKNQNYERYQADHLFTKKQNRTIKILKGLKQVTNLTIVKDQKKKT